MNDFGSRLPQSAIEDFCRRWNVHELALFGSALREDYGPDSDVDILVSFEKSAKRGLFDHIRMQQELQELFGRKVDLISRRAVERSTNWIRRASILDSARVIYSADGVVHAA